MKEQIHTIPISDALENAGECPFCYIERKAEERVLDFVLGASASYMEKDIRAQTDKAGFCRAHFKKMFDYGNSLGNAWILKTHYKNMISEMSAEFRKFSPENTGKKSRLFSKGTEPSENTIAAWCKAREESCYICDMLSSTFHSYLDTFFTMYRKDQEFRDKVASSKGFCITHFGDLCRKADECLKLEERTAFYEMLLPLEEANMNRICEDISWFIEKYDYKNKDADWKESKDAIQRGMQKLKGGNPADPVYQAKK